MKLLFFSVLLLGLNACVSHKELIYLNNVPQNADVTTKIYNQVDAKIQPDDLLSITVSSYNMEASKPYNPDATAVTSLAQSFQGTLNSAEVMTGYFVDAEGNVDFPSIGKVNVGQKTLTEAKNLMLDKFKSVLKDPIVNIRFLNLKVSILGEVSRPGVVRLTNKRLTVFEAISMSGDLTSYANRTNLLLIREHNGKRTLARLNLQSADIFKSPYYYLQQNDVLYVEPTKTRVNTVADKSSKLFAYASTGIAVVTLILTFLPK